MRRRTVDLWSPAIGAAGSVVAYGHWGRPVLVFPHEMGEADDFESCGMVEVVADLIDRGGVKLYCVDSYDTETWSNKQIPLEDRARRHGAYESWIVDQVVPWIFEDCGGPANVLTTGTSMGAFHAANFALKRADLFPQALCMSGIYDLSALYGWGERGDAMYFNTPLDYLPNMDGAHLDWLRSRVFLVLVCGQGMWEDTTGALVSTKALGGLLADKGIPHEVDLWGFDVAHDWPWWRQQFAHHLPRFADQ
jgi:esterase/lipase superfamily enzyme